MTLKKTGPLRLLEEGALLLLMGVVIVFSTAPVDIETQFYSVTAVIVLLLVLRRFPAHSFIRITYLSFSAFVVLRYLMWRTNYTIGYHDLFSFVGALALYFAELYGIIMFFLSLFVNARPIERKHVPLPTDQSIWPAVDVLIPTYDEEIELVKITLAAATSIQYPPHLLNIYLLDDGGTQEKLSDSDRIKANLALRRSQNLIHLCAELDVHYVTRNDNQNAKCGNLNNALSVLNGDLLLVLDADHVATEDILLRTAGHFLEDEDLFLVQTPHFFLTPDPIEKNLETFHRMPSENRMFYGGIQPGLDFWESSFFCGSAAVLRRAALGDEGFSGNTITEDAETALKLHAQGWRSRYLSLPMISGLQPQTFSSFMIQRIRWAQGMVQILVLSNPVVQSGLKIWQRLCYLSSMLFWLFPFARVVFLIAPNLYLVFGLKIYDANLKELVGYTLPYLVCLVLTADYLFGKQRWSMVSELYETMQSLFSLRAILSVLFNPHVPRFQVTPKSETLDADFVSPLSVPFYWFIGFSILAFIAGLWRYIIHVEDRGITLVTLLWATANIFLLVASLGALYEIRQRRTNPRIEVNIDAILIEKGTDERSEKAFPVSIRNVSVGGANLLIRPTHPIESLESPLQLRITDSVKHHTKELNVSIVNAMLDRKKQTLGVRFKPVDIREYKAIVSLVHGDSSRWIKITEQNELNPGIHRGIFFLISSGFSHSIRHLFGFFLQLKHNIAGEGLFRKAG